jgi:hypothetical protein
MKKPKIGDVVVFKIESLFADVGDIGLIVGEEDDLAFYHLDVTSDEMGNRGAFEKNEFEVIGRI